MDFQWWWSSFYYLHIIHLGFLGEGGGYINAVEATSQNADDKKVEDEPDDVNPALLFASAICYFLLDPLLLQIRLGTRELFTKWQEKHLMQFERLENTKAIYLTEKTFFFSKGSKK